MDVSIPQTYTIADILKWDEQTELILNPTFQRRKVWSYQAQTYLIDSILKGYPIPKILLRTSINRNTYKTDRDVVDGQQRLRTILDFASGELVLGPGRAREFGGSTYQTIQGEYKDRFLNYRLTCELLSGADDDDVIEIFSRINSYSLPVKPSELRNAKFQNDFSEIVKEIAGELDPLWDLGVLTLRERVRMVDQTLVAEAIAFLCRGVTNGSEQDITKFYNETKTWSRSELPDPEFVRDLMLETVGLLSELRNKRIVRRPHFLMLLAAVMYSRGNLPEGKLDLNEIADPPSVVGNDPQVRKALSNLNRVLTEGTTDLRLLKFREARETTQLMKSREVRFAYFCGALSGEFSE